MISVPFAGRPDEAPGSDSLVGVDGNAFSIMGHVRARLQEAGATKAFREAYTLDAMSGNYDHLLAVSVAYLDAETIDDRRFRSVARWPERRAHPFRSPWPLASETKCEDCGVVYGAHEVPSHE